MRISTRLSTSQARITSTLVLAFLVGVAFGAGRATAAPIGWQLSGGLYTDSEDFFLGAGARFGLASITLIPNAEYLFVDSGTTYTLNLDGTLSVLPLGVASAYVGAGLGLITVDPEVGDSNTDTGLNLMVGVGLNASPLKPFAQLKTVVMDGDDPLVLSIGARF